MNQHFFEQIMTKYEYVQQCGKGSTSRIYKIKNRETNGYFALKERKIHGGNERLNEELKLENHTNIRQYLYIGNSTKLLFLQGNKKSKNNVKYAYFISTFCEMTLRDFINIRNDVFFGMITTDIPLNVSSSLKAKKVKYEINQMYLINLFKEIVKGVRYLHQHKKIHRDIKPDNIFFANCQTNIPKIGDFGLLRDYTDSQPMILTSDVGTAIYSAPELSNKRYSFKVDVYSLGLILFELLWPINTQMERIVIFEQLRSHSKLPDEFTSCYVIESKIIEKCLKKDVSERYNSKELLIKLISILKNDFK